MPTLYFVDFNGNITAKEAKPFVKDQYTVHGGKYAAVYNKSKENAIGAGSYFTSWKIAREAALYLLDGTIARMEQNIKMLKKKNPGETGLEDMLERLKKKRKKLEEMEDPLD